MSIFTAFGDRYDGLYSPDGGKNQGSVRVYPAVVLDVCLGPGALYKSPRDLGKIRFRDTLTDYTKDESKITKEAYPLTRNIAPYPLPGEEVMIYGVSSEVTTTSGPQVRMSYMYTTVINALHNPTYNSHPFLGTSIKALTKSNPDVSEGALSVRFEQKISGLDAYKEGENINIYKQLQPFQGDFILQGRFGQSIRFGSTSGEEKAPWSIGNKNGNGILVFRVDRDVATTEAEMITVEDINVDDSSIYMCTNQPVDIALSCTAELKSWRARYSIPTAASNTSGDAGVLKSTKDTTRLLQKVVDAGGRVGDIYGKPSNESPSSGNTPTPPNITGP
jgi:hypothetical protein